MERSYRLDYQKHAELVAALWPTLAENSSPRLSEPEARMAASAVVDILVPKICEIVHEEVVAAEKRMALATGRG